MEKVEMVVHKTGVNPPITELLQKEFAKLLFGSCHLREFLGEIQKGITVTVDVYTAWQNYVEHTKYGVVFEVRWWPDETSVQVHVRNIVFDQEVEGWVYDVAEAIVKVLISWRTSFYKFPETVKRVDLYVSQRCVDPLPCPEFEVARMYTEPAPRGDDYCSEP